MQQSLCNKKPGEKKKVQKECKNWGQIVESHKEQIRKPKEHMRTREETQETLAANVGKTRWEDRTERLIKREGKRQAYIQGID